VENEGENCAFYARHESGDTEINVVVCCFCARLEDPASEPTEEELQGLVSDVQPTENEATHILDYLEEHNAEEGPNFGISPMRRVVLFSKAL
jgi:hypothetical protein